MNVIIDLNKNYFDPNKADANEMMRDEFYAAKSYVFGLGYEDYRETRSLPLDPKNHHIFTPLATYQIRDSAGNTDTINIYARALGGVIVTNEM